MKKLKILYFTFSTLCLPTSLYAADDDSKWELGVFLGASAGTVTQPATPDKPEEGKQKYVLGGVPLGIGFFRDLNENVTITTCGTLLLDIPNRLLSRQGISGGMNWHLLGGGHNIVKKTDMYEMTSSSLGQLSLVLRAGVYRYVAATKSGKTSFSGSNFEFHSGINIRSGRWGFEIIGTLASLPASTELLSTNFAELNLFYIL